MPGNGSIPRDVVLGKEKRKYFKAKLLSQKWWRAWANLQHRASTPQAPTDSPRVSSWSPSHAQLANPEARLSHRLRYTAHSAFSRGRPSCNTPSSSRWPALQVQSSPLRGRQATANDPDVVPAAPSPPLNQTAPTCPHSRSLGSGVTPYV